MMRRFLALAIVTSVSFGSVNATAAASCGRPGPWLKAIDDAPAVFVGVVLEAENRDRLATVEVEEVWKGSSIPDIVEISGGPPNRPFDTKSISTVDRSYVVGRTYVFVPHSRGDFFLATTHAVARPNTAHDSISSVRTMPWSSRQRRHRLREYRRPPLLRASQPGIALPWDGSLVDWWRCWPSSSWVGRSSDDLARGERAHNGVRDKTFSRNYLGIAQIPCGPAPTRIFACRRSLLTL